VLPWYGMVLVVAAVWHGVLVVAMELCGECCHGVPWWLLPWHGMVFWLLPQHGMVGVAMVWHGGYCCRVWHGVLVVAVARHGNWCHGMP